MNDDKEHNTIPADNAGAGAHRPSEFFDTTSGPNSGFVVNRVSIRTPPFCKDRPALWFASLEAQFTINHITVETTKFSFAVAHLDTNCTREVEDIIIDPPKTLPYTTLKNAIISRFSESYEEKIRRLLEKEQIGDRKPSFFLRHLRSLAGTSFPDDLLKSIWTSRLPRQLQIILTAQREQGLQEVAELADKLIEITTQPMEVCSIPQTQVTSEMETLSKQVAELTRVVASLTTHGHSRDRSRNRSSSHHRQRSRSCSRPRNTQLCWYHDRFAQKAQKCVAPCTWTSSGASGNERSGQ